MVDYVKEANAAYARAEKALKTGLFKWTPDYEKAANEYSKAAMAFRSAKMPDKYIYALLKAANCHDNCRSFFSAGKCYEQVASAAKDKNDWNTMVTYFEKACLYFREHGLPDPAALTYNRGARMLETVKPEKSAEWYGHASEIILQERVYLRADENANKAAEHANKAARMYLKLKQYDNAVKWAEKALENYSKAYDDKSIGKQIYTLVIIHLARDDPIAAQKVYLTYKSSVELDERFSWTIVLGNLFRGFDNFDNAAISSALKSPLIQNVDNEITKIIRDLLIKYEPKKSAAAAGDNHGEVVEQEEDDEAGPML